MSRFQNHLVVAAAVVGLAVTGSMMNSRQSTVQGAGEPVVSINPAQLPLPVVGSTTVSGTVGLAAGTTVGLASGSTVSLASGASVLVGVSVS
jgi:hypothetical protein